MDTNKIRKYIGNIDKIEKRFIINVVEKVELDEIIIQERIVIKIKMD